MVRLSTNSDGSLTFNVTVSQFVVYLDSFAVFDLAENNTIRRNRFLDAIHSGADLLFSISNVAELSGPESKSSILAVRSFLDDIGAHWIPAELDTVAIVHRERNGEKAPGTFISANFLKDYVAVQMKGSTPSASAIIDPSRDLLRLGPLFDWLAPQRDSIQKGLAELDAVLLAKTAERKMKYKQNPAWLDDVFPVLKFRGDMPATFTQFSLMRDLILGKHTLKKNDGADFCHAIVASSFANIAALDKKWKRRIEALPKPNNLARIYCQPELDDMVSAIESMVNKTFEVSQSHRES